MPYLSIGHHATESLESFLRNTITPLIQEHHGRVDLDVEVDGDISIPCDRRWTAALVESLVRASLHEMPDDGELFVTACRCGDRVELEIADNGPEVESRFRWRPLVAAKIGATLLWQDCPQGGTAVTVKFPPVAADALQRRAA